MANYVVNIIYRMVRLIQARDKMQRMENEFKDFMVLYLANQELEQQGIIDMQNMIYNYKHRVQAEIDRLMKMVEVETDSEE